MKIGFILPMPTTKIVGGYKVVYEYANYLSKNGNDVTIFYDCQKGANSKSLPKVLVYYLRKVISLREPSWFTLSKRIKKRAVYCLKKDYFNNFDVAIATAAETAVFVNTLSIKKKIYLIQDFEKNWKLSEEELYRTYNYPDMTLVTVSKRLLKLVSEHTNKKIEYVPNGINSNIFYNQNKDRNQHSISMLYHLDERKGADIGLKVIFDLKDKYPDLEAYLFGSPSRPNDWPQWIHYTQSAKPNQVADLMNRSKVFLCTSRNEGFGLTGLESLFCGCKFVTTDCGGIREYANEDNSIICKVDDIDGLEKGVMLSFKDKQLFNDKMLSNHSLYNSQSKFMEICFN